MKKILATTALAVLVFTPALALAATVTNLDAEAHTLVVTEGGQQVEVLVSAGDTVEICPGGCFVTMPNGDREALVGTERIEIQAGRGRIF